MKRFLVMLLTAVIGASAVLPAAGCSSKKSGSSDSEKVTSTAASTVSESAAETTTTTTTTAPLMPPMSAPSEMLDGFDQPGNTMNIFCGYDNTVVFQPSLPDGQICYVFDPITNSTVRTLKLDNITEQLLGTFSDGTIVTMSYKDRTELHYYPKDSDNFQAVDLNTDVIPDIILDMENECLYSPQNRSKNIVRYERDGSSSTLFDAQGLSYINTIDPETMTFCANEYSEGSEDNMATGLYSLEDGTRLAKFYGTSNFSFLTETKCLSIVNDYSKEIPECNVEVYDRETGKYEKTYSISGSKSLSYTFDSSDESDYVFLSAFENDMNGKLAELLFFDAKTGRYASLGNIDTDIMNLPCCYCKNLRRWIVALNIKDGYSYRTQLMMVDPALLTYDNTFTGTTTEHAEFVPYQCGEALKDVRKKADEIESKYAVKLLIGDEVKNAEAGSTYTFISTESAEYGVNAENEMEHLKALEYQLSRLPDDFLNHFRTSAGTFGLRISIVDGLESTSYTTFSAGGVAYQTGPWYDIAIDNDLISYAGTSFYHELWHSTEQLIESNFGFNEDEWCSLNPEGFEYHNDFDRYMTGINDKYTTLASIEYDPSAYDRDPYFISEYSLVTPMEDRATLIEFLMGWRFDDNREYQFGTEGISKYPHLKAKLDLLAEMSKKEFGYVYWDEAIKNSEGTYSTFEQY